MHFLQKRKGKKKKTQKEKKEQLFLENYKNWNISGQKQQWL